MAGVIATTARIVTPVLLPMAAYIACPNAPERFALSVMYPPQFVCQVIAILILLGVGIAWSLGDASVSKDISYFILTALIAGSMLLNCKDAQKYRQMIANVTVFIVSFLVYSAADCEGAEKIVLAPVVSMFLLDMILSVQAMHPV